MHQQLAEVHVDNALSMRCQGNRLPSGATCLNMTGPNWWPTELDDETKQQKSTLHTSRNPFRQKQMRNFMEYDIWPWFMLWHCAAYCGECDTVLYDQFWKVALCVNRWQQSRKNDGLSVFSNIMQERGTTVCIKSSGDETWIYHFTPTSKQPVMEWKHPGSPRKQYKVTLNAGKVLATIFLYLCAAGRIRGTCCRDHERP